MTNPDNIEAFKTMASPTQAAAARMPMEQLVDGKPAVRYCTQFSAASIPFSVVTTVAQPDFRVELQTQAITD